MVVAEGNNGSHTISGGKPFLCSFTDNYTVQGPGQDLQGTGSDPGLTPIGLVQVQSRAGPDRRSRSRSSWDVDWGPDLDWVESGPGMVSLTLFAKNMAYSS